MNVEASLAALGQMRNFTDGLFYPWSVREEHYLSVIAGSLQRLSERVHEKQRPALRSELKPLRGKHGTYKKAKDSSISARDRLIDALVSAQASSSVVEVDKQHESEFLGALANLTRDNIVVQGGRKTKNAVIRPVGLAVASFSGSSSQYSPARDVPIRMLGDDGGTSDALRRLVAYLSETSSDVLTKLTTDLTLSDAGQPGEFVPRKPAWQLLPVRPVLDYPNEVARILDHAEAGTIDRQLFFEMFLNLSCLRIAQYFLTVAELANRYARDLRRRSTGMDVDASYLDPDALAECSFGLPLGVIFREEIQNRLFAFHRSMCAIHLARLVHAEGHVWDRQCAKDMLQTTLDPGVFEALDQGRARPNQSAKKLNENISAFGKGLLHWSGGDAAGGLLEEKKGSGHLLVLSDPMLQALTYGVVPAGTKQRSFDDIMVQLRRSGFNLDEHDVEGVAGRLGALGLLDEMPDAERYRQVRIP